MCLQVPGKVVERQGNKVIVDYDIEKRAGLIEDVDCNVGDWVLVVGKFVIEVVPESVGRESLNHWKNTMLG